MTGSTPDYHVVMIRSGHGTFAVSNSHMLWSDALDAIHDAICEGCKIEFVHHIHDGGYDDRTNDALDTTRAFMAAIGSPAI